MSFGVAVRQRDRGAQPGCGDGRLPAEHRRGRAVAVPPQRRRPRLPDRHVATSAAATSTATSTWPGSRTWSPRRRSGPSRSSCRRAPSPASAACCRRRRSARRSPRSAASSRRGLRLAEPAPGLRRRRLDARLRRDWSPTRPASRSASSRRSATWSSGTTWSSMHGLGRRTAVASTSSTSTAARVAPARRRWCSPTRWPSRSGIGFAEVYSRFARAGLTDDVTFIGAGKLGHPRERRRGVRPRRRQVQVGREAMLAIGCIQAQKCHTDHCPIGSRDPEPPLHPRPGSRPQERPPGQLRDHAAPRPAQGLRGGRRRPSGADRPRRRRRGRRDVRSPDGCARSTATSPAGASLGPALREEIATLMAGTTPERERPPTD